MTPKTPAQEWAELKDELAGLLTRSHREIAALVEKLPDAFLMREGRTIRELLQAGDNFMAKVQKYAEARIESRIEEAKKPAAQPKRTA